MTNAKDIINDFGREIADLPQADKQEFEDLYLDALDQCLERLKKLFE